MIPIVNNDYRDGQGNQNSSFDSTIKQELERKYQQNFEQFTQAIQYKATLEAEEDWMEWKGAVEM
ncbi:MAG: hypothetical protein RBT80_10315 [Candidatus Vecturithrix sp.]|jgi:hypothetical protein|nr:hypothetical protein [Candidatus Vecturithrix sp.]